jgi:hypothetical protein
MRELRRLMRLLDEERRRVLEVRCRAGGSLERAQVIGLPPLKPSGVDFSPHNREIIFLYGEGHPAVMLTAEHLGALLVSYCVKAHIPLPRLPDKVIRVEPSTMVLAFDRLYAKAPSW